MRSIAAGQRSGPAGSVRSLSLLVQKSEISAALNYSNHKNYSFGSAIFDYSRIFEQFVSTLVLMLQAVSESSDSSDDDDDGVLPVLLSLWTT